MPLSARPEQATHSLAVAAICTALDLHPDEWQLSAFVQFADLLQRWNRVYNLTALRAREAVLSHHLADCLAAMPALRRQFSNVGRSRLLDVGSGGGLPGVVAAILFPGLEVVCVDAVAKKAAFIQQVAATLGLENLQAQHGRVEQLCMGQFEVIAARAFAGLSDFYRLTQAHAASDGVWMAMKGKVPDVEMASLPPEVEVFHVEHLTVPGLQAERCLVWMKTRLA